MSTVFRWLFRAVLLAAGLVFAVSLTLAFVGLALGWAVRSAWLRVTGRPARPFVVRIDPRAGFRRAAEAAGARAGGARGPLVGRPGDVTDVEPKPRG